MTTFKTKFAQRLTRSIRHKAASAVACFAATLPLSLTLGASSAQAAGYAGTQFEIEMVVFSRTQGMNASRETWPTNPVLKYDSHWVDFNTPSKRDPMVPALQPVPDQLGNKVAALKRDSGYQVLFHKTWRQVLQTERNAPAVLISGGEASGNHHQLEGSVTLSVSRYLHLSTDLWLSEWADPYGTGNSQWNTGPMDASQQANAAGIKVPTRPRALPNPALDQPSGDEPMGLLATGQNANSPNGGFSTSADRAVFHGDSETPALPMEKIAKRVAVLQEERRLRSGELHYIDHPKLGVLIEVRTVESTPENDSEPAGLTD